MNEPGTHRVIEWRGARISAESMVVPRDALRSLERELTRAIEGDVRFDIGERALYSTDASNYRQIPYAVVKPKTAEDAVATVKLCAKYDVPVSPRGGGTSLAGQGCNSSVQIDFSKYMDKVLHIDPAAKRAVVEPGCVLDTLRNAAEKHGLTFGPDPSTHDHNSLGGMIGNNSCGVHSIMAGRTADNVHSLDIVTYDGLRMTVGPTPPEELERIIGEGGRRGQIYRDMREFWARHGHRFQQVYPDIPRRVSGYENLDQLSAARGFNVARALTGTEANCAIVLKATLDLVDSPPHRILAIIGFPDVFTAGDHALEIRDFGPIGIEAIDHLLVEYMKKKNFKVKDLEVLPEGKAWLITEFGADSIDAAAERARPMIERMKARGYTACIVKDKAKQAEVWEVREAGLAVTAHVPGTGSSWPGWEDSAVAVKDLGNYLRELKALFHKHGYEASVYGHFGDGLVHCRINFELHTEDGLRNWRAFLDEAADLVVRYGGSLSGEHGDGQARAELLDKMYGAELIAAQREFRAIWDPLQRMNPGKLMDAYPITANLRYGPDYRLPEIKGLFAYPEDEGSFSRATMRCVGVGKCRRHDPKTGVMCPSYLATREEKHSTRGRARILNEMLRGDELTEGWGSEAVREALSLCLACKGCKKDCPVQVDMASYKAEFHARHYQGRLRPRSAYSMGQIQRWARIAAAVPWLANFVTRTPGLAALTKFAGGIAQERTMPAFSSPTFLQWYKRRPVHAHGERVILWPDTFNNYFRSETAIAATALLEELGFCVDIPKATLCCGRPLYDWGWIDQAKALWRQTLSVLADDIRMGTPIIGLEPACVSAFRDELVELFPGVPLAKKLSEQTMMLGKFLEHRKIAVPLKGPVRKALVQFHCHHHAVLDRKAEWDLLARLPIDTEIIQGGCCGMAGSFGFEAEKYDVSMKIGELGVLPAVRKAAADSVIVANGFSCREQIEQGTGRKTLHLAQLLAGQI
jgi:FAD/FMN-containing dehydrogenase/Fe-S oxidoreductase